MGWEQLLVICAVFSCSSGGWHYPTPFRAGWYHGFSTGFVGPGLGHGFHEFQGRGGNLPADVHVTGDPRQDRKLNLKIASPHQNYDMHLMRMDSNILHEQVKYLWVDVDNKGRTTFNEASEKVDMEATAKRLNFYHDPLTGTFVCVRIGDGLDPYGKPQMFVEGVIQDELMIAPPMAKMRHKRSLYPVKHTMWKKESDKEIFANDALKVPDIFDSALFNKNNSHTIHKRQAQQVRIEPELLLFVDYGLYTQFEGDSNEMLEYLLHFWHAVNWKFLTVALSQQWPVIDLKIKEIGVFRNRGAQPFIEANRVSTSSKLFSLYDAMDSLQKWLIRYENILPVHDVAFLQTGDDACRRGRSPGQARRGQRMTSWGEDDEDDTASSSCVAGTAGVAYVRGACLSAPYFRGYAYNFGIGEASTSFNGVIIAAHEMGHLIGAYHDGESEARICPRSSGYIMSYTREDAYRFSRFSDCSVRSFQSFLTMDRSRCLTQRSSFDTLQFPNTFPGVYMTLQEQCRRFTGGPPCEFGPKQCEHLCCDDAKGEWRYTRSEPAVDGTNCGPGRVCLNGECMPLARLGAGR